MVAMAICSHYPPAADRWSSFVCTPVAARRGRHLIQDKHSAIIARVSGAGIALSTDLQSDDAMLRPSVVELLCLCDGRKARKLGRGLAGENGRGALAKHVKLAFDASDAFVEVAVLRSLVRGGERISGSVEIEHVSAGTPSDWIECLCGHTEIVLLSKARYSA